MRKQITVIRFANEVELRGRAISLLAAVCEQRSETPCAVMLSGGQTPLPIYQALAKQSLRVSSELRVLFSDERMVPATDGASNYGRTRPLFSALGLPPQRILRVMTELPLAEAAHNYHQALDRFLSAAGKIRLGLLGLGTDGHTASIYTPEQARYAGGEWAMAVPRNPGPDRVSVTPALLRRVERIIFLATGLEKRAVIDRLSLYPETLPAGLAVEGASEVEIWTANAT